MLRFYLNMLKQKHLTMLWVSQVLSAIGDQLHSLAVLWISVQIGGANAGFVAAAGTAAGVVVGLFAGVYADRWNRRIAMIAVDLLRAVAVLVLAVIAQYGSLQLWQMGLVAVIVSALGSLFHPCLFASLPALTDEPPILRAMTALMIMTFRLARLIGPGIAGIILAYFPIHTFFVIDSASYVVSAVAIVLLGNSYVWRPENASTSEGLKGIACDLTTSARLAFGSGQLALTMALGLIEAGLWCAAYLVGIPLMIKQAALGTSASNVTAYASIICAYGLGNVVSNIIVGPHDLHRRATFFAGLGVTIMGIGFILLSCSPNLALACLAAVLAAAGGPIIDIATITLLQQVPDEHRGKLNGFRNFMCGLGSAIGLSLAPALFASQSGARGIAFCGAGIFIAGVAGIMFAPMTDRRQLRSVQAALIVSEDQATCVK